MEVKNKKTPTMGKNRTLIKYKSKYIVIKLYIYIFIYIFFIYIDYLQITIVALESYLWLRLY